MSTLEVLYPMLASAGKVTDDMLADDSDWIAQEKVDGCRYIMSIEHDCNRFTSRQKSRVTGIPVEKTENVPHLSHLVMPELAGTVLDGEIQHDDFSQTVSIMGSLSALAIEKQEKMGYIKYKVFDIIRHNGVDVSNLGYADRIKLATEVVNSIRAKYGVDYIMTLPVYTQNKLDLFHSIINRGGEGLVLKNKYSPYLESSDSPTRSKMQIKLKKYITDDVVIMGATEPTRLYDGIDVAHWQLWSYGEPVTRAWHSGWIGAIKFGKYVENNLVELGQTSGIDDNTRILLSDGHHGIKSEYIGTVMEIGAMEQIKKTGAYRHPRFLRLRPEKNAEECVL